MPIYLGSDLVNLRNDINKRYHIGFLFTLPSEYKQVEYLESTGEQYINTGYVPKATDKWEIKFALKEIGGSIIGAGTSGLRRDICSIAATNSISTRCADYDNIVIASYDTDIHTIIVDHPNKNIIFDGTDIALTGSFHSTTTTLGLFAQGSGGYLSKSKIYYTKLYDDGVLTRNFIPCYRKSDRKPGLYDLVNDRFYTNVGTGEFLLPQRLPSEYQEVRWIKPISGIPYIDTEISGGNNINLKIQAKLYRTDNNACLIGMRSSSFNAGAKDITIATEGGVPTIYYQHVGESGHTNITPDAIYNVKTTNTKLIDADTGETMITLPEPAIWGASKNFYVGCLNNNGVAERPFYGEIYQVEIYDNDDLVKQLVPCYHRTDETIGMYDLKNNTFHHQRGTGSFIRGENVYE